jgi:hypothetical protein
VVSLGAAGRNGTLPSPIRWLAGQLVGAQRRELERQPEAVADLLAKVV